MLHPRAMGAPLSIAPSQAAGDPWARSCVPSTGPELKKKERRKNDFIIRTVYKSSVDGRADQTNFLLEKKFSYPQLFICKSHEYMIY